MAVPKKKLKKSLFPPVLATSGVKAAATTAAEDHLLKQLALRYMVDQTLSIREVAKTLGTTPKKLKSFFEDEFFKQELSERIERVHGVGTNFMQSQAKISLMHLYEEMRRREAEGELKDVPLRELHKILIDTQKELRLDTPGAFTSKVGVADLGDLQGRYKKSLSGRSQSKLKNVTPKEATVGSINVECEKDQESQVGGVG